MFGLKLLGKTIVEANKQSGLCFDKSTHEVRPFLEEQLNSSAPLGQNEANEGLNGWGGSCKDSLHPKGVLCGGWFQRRPRAMAHCPPLPLSITRPNPLQSPRLEPKGSCHPLRLLSFLFFGGVPWTPRVYFATKNQTKRYCKRRRLQNRS